MNKKDLVKFRQQEAADFVKKFYQSSWDWRNASYHSKWDNQERNYRSIYNPTISAMKEEWQSRVFVPMTVSQIEVIAASVTKILLGRKYPIGVEPREMGDELQAELNTHLLNHQLDLSNFTVTFDDVLKEALIYGSGFMKTFWEKKEDKRRILKEKKAGFMDMLTKGAIPGSKVGYDEVVEDVLVKDQVSVRKIHVRDIFLEPNSTDMQRVLERTKITYAEIKANVKNGFDKEQVEELWNVYESSTFEVDVQPLKYAQDITDPQLPRPEYDKQHTVWEYWGPVPRKWIEMDIKDGEEAEVCVPGKIMVASGSYFLASEVNPYQCMEPPYLQMDYIRTGNTYGMGAAEIIAGLQEEYNEVRNLRMDNVNLVLNKIFIAVKRKLENPEALVSKPGGVIFVKGSDVDDVRKVVAEMPISDVAISGFRETGELERQIQEATGANRVTTGTAGLTRDTNQTATGMELLRQAAADRFTKYSFIISKMFLIKAAQRYLELIYQNMSDEMVKRVLGMQPIEYLPQQWAPKFELWERTPPQDLLMAYDVVPFDVFSEENKQAKKADLAGYAQLIATLLPGWDPKPVLKKLGRLNGFTTEEVDQILTMIQDMGAIPTPMSQGQGIPSVPNTATGNRNAPPSPTGPTPGIPGQFGAAA